MDSFQIIKHPLSSEKSIRLMESENKLIFLVDRHATKNQIKHAIKEIFNVNVESVNTLFSPKGEKRAYVKFNSESPAIDIATNMGMM